MKNGKPSIHFRGENTEDCYELITELIASCNLKNYLRKNKTWAICDTDFAR